MIFNIGMAGFHHHAWKTSALGKVLWAILSSFALESLVFGLSALPAILFWKWHLKWEIPGPGWIHTLVLSMAFIPAYLLFAVFLMLLSAFATRLAGWRTPADREMSIAEPDWPLLNWGRYLISIEMVRFFAGHIFRTTPIWVLYMRLNGARMGKRVWVNSLWVTDHNLLEFGDDVVIGSEVHLSGHTVENGLVKTARTRLGSGVTVGASSVMGIGVEVGDRCQIGALSFVPKFSRLEPGATYAGIPVHRLEHPGKAVAS